VGCGLSEAWRCGTRRVMGWWILERCFGVVCEVERGIVALCGEWLATGCLEDEALLVGVSLCWFLKSAPSLKPLQKSLDRYVNWNLMHSSPILLSLANFEVQGRIVPIATYSKDKHRISTE
jgi:hypothetical protein